MLRNLSIIIKINVITFIFTMMSCIFIFLESVGINKNIISCRNDNKCNQIIFSNKYIDDQKVEYLSEAVGLTCEKLPCDISLYIGSCEVIYTNISKKEKDVFNNIQFNINPEKIIIFAKRKEYKSYCLDRGGKWKIRKNLG